MQEKSSGIESLPVLNGFSLIKKPVKDLFSEGVWRSDLAFGGNKIEYYINPGGYKLLEKLLEKSDFIEGGGALFQQLFTKTHDKATLYVTIAPHGSAPDNVDIATISIGVEFNKNVDEEFKQELYRKFLDYLKNCGEEVYPPVGLIGSVAGKRAVRERDLFSFIKRKLDFVRAMRRHIKLTDERLDYLKVRGSKSYDKSLFEDKYEVISYKGVFKKEDYEAVISYPEQQLGSPVRIVLTFPEKIGIVKGNRLLLWHSHPFNQYISNEEQILYLSALDDIVIYARLIEKPHPEFEAGVFFDMRWYKDIKLEKKVLKYFKHPGIPLVEYELLEAP